MTLFDTHFHYSREDGTPEAYRAAIDASLAATPGAPMPERLLMLAVGGNYEDSIAARDFAAATDGAWFAAGVHPSAVATESHCEADFDFLFADPRCKAIGELGLDYYYDAETRDVQLRTLEGYLECALKWKRPAILHLRDRDEVWGAYEDAYAMARDFAAAGGQMDVHCFTGSPEWAEKFLALGAMLGITGIVTFKRSDNVRETLKVIPDDRILLETDSPYLAPVPHRGRTNTPGFLPLIAERVAAERGLTVAELAKITTNNACRLFQIEGVL